MDLSPRRDEIIAKSLARYEKRSGNTASVLLIATAVDVSLQEYETAEGREELLARIGEAKAHMKQVMLQKDPKSQETFDVLDAVRDTFESILGDMN